MFEFKLLKTNVFTSCKQLKQNFNVEKTPFKKIK